MEYAEEVMQRLTMPTGGRAFFTDSIDELQGAFAELLDELSNQYLLGYQPTNTKRDDTWREIKVEVDGYHERPCAAGLPRDCRTNEMQTTPRIAPCSQASASSLRVSASPAAPSCRRSSQQPQPRFQSSVDVTSLDVSVVDDGASRSPT